MKTIVTQLDRKPTAMIVDDSDELRKIVKELLIEEGYEVYEASNGKDALVQLLGSLSLPDILITDMNMPVMTGQELVAAIRAIDKTRHLPILAYSGSLYFENDPRLKGCMFISKPFDINKLLDVLTKLTINTTTTIASNGGAINNVHVDDVGCFEKLGNKED